MNDDEIIIYAHNNGKQKNIHYYDYYQTISPQDRCTPILKGATGVINTVEDFERHMLDHGYVSRFPPSHEIQNDNLRQFTDDLEKNMPKGTRFFCGYDTNKHIVLLDRSKKEFTEISDNTLVVMDQRSGIIALLQISERTENEILTVELEELNIQLKNMLTLYGKTLQNTYITIFGGLILPNVTKQHLLDFNESLKDNLIIVTKKDLKDSRSWWHKVVKRIQDFKRVSGMFFESIGEFVLND